MCNVRGLHASHIGWVDDPQNLQSWANEDFVIPAEQPKASVEWELLNFARQLRS